MAITGELGCHSEDTLVLTPNGIKHWKDIKIGDYVYGINNKLQIVKAKVEWIHIYPYKGKMIHFYSKHYDFLVTPNNRMLFRKHWWRDFRYINAEDVIKSKINGYFPSIFWDEGKNITTFDIYEYLPLDIKEKLKNIKHKTPPLPIEDFLTILGMYISEGSITGSGKIDKGNYVQITNMNFVGDFTEVLERNGLHYKVYRHGNAYKVIIFHQDLAFYLWLRAGRGAKNKRIPPEIMELDPRLLRHLLFAMWAGDGSYNQSYYTISEQLRDDIIIMALRMGLGVRYTERKPGKERFLVDHVIKPRNISYEIHISFNPMNWFTSSPDKSWNNHKNYEIVDYDGIVWSLTTSTGNYFTVRNGKVQVAGNSGKTLSAVYLTYRNYQKFEEEAKTNEERKKYLRDKIEELTNLRDRNPQYFKEVVFKLISNEQEQALKAGDYGAVARLQILTEEIKEQGADAFIDFLKTEYEFLEQNTKKRSIYSNITLYDMWFYKLNTLSELNWAKNGFMLLDELWSVGLDARMSRRKKNVITANILGKSRKRSLTIAFTVQTLRQLDKRIVDVLDFVAYPVTNSDGSICRLYIWRGNKPKGKPLKVLRFFTEDVYKLYNTREEVPELIDDTDENGEGEKEPEYKYIPSKKNPAWVEYLIRKKYGVRKIV